MLIKYVRTCAQQADILTKGCFSHHIAIALMDAVEASSTTRQHFSQTESCTLFAVPQQKSQMLTEAERMNKE